MDDIKAINEYLDKLDLLLENKDKELKEKIAERDAERASKNRNGERVLKLNKEIKGIENGKEEIERKQKIAFRQLARTTEEGKELQRQYDEDQRIQKEANELITQLNIDWNISEGSEKEAIGIERADLKEKISEFEKDKAGIVSKLEKIGRELREQYKEGTLAVEDSEEPQNEFNPEPIEPRVESEPVVDENVGRDESKTKELPEELFVDIDEFDDEISEDQEDEPQFDERIQEGINRIAEIRNLMEEYKEEFEKVCEKMPEGALGASLINDLNRLEKVVAKKFGLLEQGEEVEGEQSALDVVMQQIDNIKESLESTTGEALKEKMMQEFGILRDTVQETIPEQNKTEIIDFIENAMNYVESDFLFKSEDELKAWIMQDLKMLEECLPEKFGVISQEQEEASEEEPQTVVVPELKEQVVATEWKSGVQKIENSEGKEEGENMSTNSKPESSTVSTGTSSLKPETRKQMEALSKRVDDISAVIKTDVAEVNRLKERIKSLPEGSDERKKMEEKVTRKEAGIRILTNQARKEQNEYDQLVKEEDNRKEEKEKQSDSEEQKKKNASEKPTIHIKGIEGTPNEIILLKMLKDSGLMYMYKKEFESKGRRAPDMSLDDIGSLMEKVTQKVKDEKNKTKRRSPERKEIRKIVKKFNKDKKQIKKQMKLIKKQMREKDLDDYEFEM